MPDTIIAATTVISDKRWAVSDLEQMPRGYHYEILEGVLYQAAMPGWPHAIIVSNLLELLGPWVRSRRLGRVLPPQTGLYWNETNYIDPDLVNLRPEQLPAPGAYPRSAALAVEVLSPSNLRASREEREVLLQHTVVEEVWYVDYNTRSLEIRRLEVGGYKTAATFQGEAMVRSQQFPGLEFPLTALWEDIIEFG